jgi:hypothetical protein
MKQNIVSFILFVILFLCCLLLFKFLVSGGFLLFDSYYSENSYENVELFREKRFNLTFYSILISLILVGFIGIIIGRFLKNSYLIIIFSYIISFLLFRVSYLKIAELFTFTNSSFINIAILSTFLLTIIYFCLKKLMN